MTTPRQFLVESGPHLRVTLPARSARDAAEMATRGGVVRLIGELTYVVEVKGERRQGTTTGGVDGR